MLVKSQYAVAALHITFSYMKRVKNKLYNICTIGSFTATGPYHITHIMLFKKRLI